jgi:putative ABC transport system permease protein
MKSDNSTNGIGWIGIVRLAFRELRSGLGGFYIFIACVALGVMVITAVGTLADALRAGFDSQGARILGGDVTFSRMHARSDGEERAWLQAQGKLSETASMRTLVRRLDGEDQILVEIKGTDTAYPLLGDVKLKDLIPSRKVWLEDGKAAVDPILLERLRVRIGDRVRIGELEVEVAAAIAEEPDGIIDRLTYGPRVLVSLETMQKTGLMQPGALIRWKYAILLAGDTGATAEGLKAFRARATELFPESGFTITDRRDPSPQVTRTLERLRQFLTLLGLTSLLVGGVGIANAVSTFIDRRRKVIATMKSLGATSGTVFALFLTQVMIMAILGVLIGLSIGIAIPPLISYAAGTALPIKTEFAVSAASLTLAAAYGSLVALAFTLWPLGHAEQISASALFRDEITPGYTWPRRGIVAGIGVITLLLTGLAIATSEAKLLALYFCAGVIGVFAVFVGLGEGVTRLARRAKRPRVPELALAVGNLGAPGGLTRSVVLSLGSGLSLLVAVALSDASLVSELSSRLPAKSPDYFVLDIPKDDFKRLADAVLEEEPAAEIIDAPMLRGRLIRLKERAVETIKAPPEAQWVLSGDRGLTYADDVPHGSKLVKGSWWAKDYDGPPLVSFEAELAEKLGVDIGDTVTVNVLGRNVTATIANLREVKWETLALNFVMVFSPNTLEGAPHNLLATITLPKDIVLEKEAGIARKLGKLFPSISAVRVKDAINAFNVIFSKIMVAVRVAGGVTLCAGALVLAGALATAQRRRILEAIVLKVIGATRARILAAHAAEYLLLASATTVFALALGTFASWLAVTQIMELEFAFSWPAALQALALATGLVLTFGAIGTASVLSARPAAYLKSE